MKYRLYILLFKLFCQYFYTGTCHFISAKWFYDPNRQIFKAVEVSVTEKHIYIAQHKTSAIHCNCVL